VNGFCHLSCLKLMRTPVFVVLTDVSDSTQHLLSVAATLAAPLGARLVLLHVFHDLLLEPEMAPVAAAYTERNRDSLRKTLAEWAAVLPVPAEVEISVEPLSYAIEAASGKYEPVAFVLGINSPESWFDRLLTNAALPILRSAFYPLLLIPTASRQRPKIPRHALIAADGDAIHLTAAGLAARRALLDAWQTTVRLLHIAPGKAGDGPSAAAVLESVRQGLDLPALPTEAEYSVIADEIAPSILRAAERESTDLLILITRPRSFLSELFHRSVTAQVARHSPIPVLLLPTLAE
jgi:nucleotide-binding universal stress UspA family protein